ncbi:PucR family transcriptional regulator [Mycolicibacterium vaccae]|uniref:Purine catabolism PurC domain-containing protein n=1 Tax=Mycolicibacterium vaccae ATCC 25954 TaxID=1194972 RepID=K0UTB6_MYCVA|nr:PucR family transcriptional regulator [Mycolicibacterium vaccae]ANI37320.1 PucR family transcriptional regulator [Mycolicibacterium vaccae 95051]EJZ05853.1 purine catabolism PurC domain-containing protein [Mycolicibacterium vaccae ATCC 25954]MCV7064197.1 PucR family transcriptional regulator [Mycolicibacterium vaccae]
MSEVRVESAAPTLRDLLETAGPGLSVPEGGPQDLDRAISWVHTTEMRDPSRYLLGGELVCTVGISLQTGNDCAVFVDALTRAGAAGVCFGVGDGHDAVPSALMALCRTQGLPVLVAPPSVPFSQISRFVADFRLGSEIAVARATNALAPELLASLRRHDSPRQLLDSAGQVLGCYFLLEPLAGACGASSAPSLSGGADDDAVTVPVPGLGTLVWVGRGDRPEPALLDLIARFVRAAQGERDIEAALARERVGQLLSLVERRMLLPDALGQLLQWPGFGGEIACSAWPAGAGALLSMAFPDALIGDAPDLCLMLTVGALEATEDLALPSGHSAPVPLTDIGSAIAQARIALTLAEQRGGRVGPDQLSTLESLLEQLPLGQLAPFKQLLIDPLAEMDNQRGTQHVRTLRAFLSCNGSLSDTAKELFLHTNTVRHRLSRIQEITGRDPLQHNDLTAFVIGLWAAERGE